MMETLQAPASDLGLSAAVASRLTTTGALHAMAILASVALGARLARRRGLSPRLIVEIHAVGVPAAIVLARLPALAQAFPAFLHDAGALARVAASPPSAAPAILGLFVLIALMAWASGRPRALSDCLAPGAVLVASALLLGPCDAGLAARAVLLTVAACGGCIAHRLAQAGARPGEAALVAGQALVLTVVSTLPRDRIPSLGLVACAVALGLLFLSHVLLRVRAAEAVADGTHPGSVTA
jgi:hypothetical protein